MPIPSKNKPKNKKKFLTKNGRKKVVKYSQEQLHIVKGLCIMGAKNEKIAKVLGVPCTTVDHWVSEDPFFRQVVLEYRELSSSDVVRSLYERAKGYDYEEDVLVRGKNNKLGVVKRITKHVPCDVSAAKFYLYNRTRALPDEEDRWLDKQQHEVTGAGGNPLIPFTGISFEFVSPKKEEPKE